MRFWVVTQYSRHPSTLPCGLPLVMSTSPQLVSPSEIVICLSWRKDLTKDKLLSDAPQLLEAVAVVHPVEGLLEVNT